MSRTFVTPFVLVFLSAFALAENPEIQREQAILRLNSHGVRVRDKEVEPDKTVTEIFFGCHRCPPSLLKNLAHVPDVYKMNLRLADDVTNEDLKVMRGLVNLNELLIHHCPFDDKSVAHLKSLPNLRTLHFSSSTITDEGLKHLSEMKNLESLRITGEGITDQGVDHIEKLTNLKFLGLQRTSISDARIKELRAALPNTRISLYSR